MKRFLGCLFGVVLATSAWAEVRCPGIFGDHMVLQRERPVAVWGTASPEERVTVAFAGQQVATTAGADGRWEVRLSPLPASAEPRTLLVKGTNTLTFSDVLVGEVWFCSGQSNMEMRIVSRKGRTEAVDNFETEIRNADHPLLRFYQVPHRGEPDPQILGLRWVPCSPETIQTTEFSAVGYFFGREILGELGVPVGLIHASFGASQIEGWMPEGAFTANPRLRAIRNVTYPAWTKGMQATELYESMVRPYVPFGLRGFLWYQGEANCLQADDAIYTEKMRALVESWRTAWAEPEAPWYYVQIAPYRYSRVTGYGKNLTPEELPVFWEAQAAALAIPHTGMVVTTDLAGDRSRIHPTNKRDVGLRLARLALVETYHRTTALVRSPRNAGVSKEEGRLKIRFADAGTGLATRDGQPVREFMIAGADRAFVPAEARVEGDAVIVSSSAVPEPVAVRFAWRELADPNLVNSAGLPAIPFRTDDWPVPREREAAEAHTPPPASTPARR